MVRLISILVWRPAVGVAAVVAAATLAAWVAGRRRLWIPPLCVQPSPPAHLPRRRFRPARSTWARSAPSREIVPYLDVPTAQDEEGNRIGAIVVLRAGGRTVGCRFSYYYDGHPVLEITSARFRSATLAYNAMVRLGQSGTHQIPVHDLIPGVDGVLYQTAFNPPDERLDWACSFATGDTVVTVKTDQKNVSFNARNIAKTIAPKF